MNVWAPHTFAATFLAQAAVAALSAFILFGVRLPKTSTAAAAGGRPIGIIARQPGFVTAVVCATV
ncbi:exported hypothetical protein [Paraburkholderia ribeironis]|uniref:Uncharacterized protein n=1 Tax=Paraburkholderia ribeironis TaxID=1247936 RepID=A0A1N7SC03_9BURK|nr:exported hypothetical protein [Paraburkholderia ribeironis]